MKKQLTVFDYTKLLLLNVIVAFVIALAAIGFVYADGVDDPNFYKDFNPSNPQPKYDKFAPPGWKVKQYHYGNVPPIQCNRNWTGECKKEQQNIPEPHELIMLSAGMIAMVAWKRFKK